MNEFTENSLLYLKISGMKRFTRLAFLILFILTPIFSASAHIAQSYHDYSATVSPTLNVAKRQLNAPQAQLNLERSRRLPPLKGRQPTQVLDLGSVLSVLFVLYVLSVLFPEPNPIIKPSLTVGIIRGNAR